MDEELVISKELIERMGRINPRLALAFTDYPNLVPNSYEVRAEFTNGAEGTPVETAFKGRTVTDMWVTRIDYTVQRPAYNAGSPIRAWLDEYESHRPMIDVYGKIDAEDKNDFTSGNVPIETIFAPAGVRDPEGFMAWRGLVIPRNGTPWMRLTLGRTLNDGEVPYIVRIIFKVLELRGCRYSSVSHLEALAQLKGLGYCK